MRDIRFRAWDITQNPPRMEYFGIGEGFSGLKICPIMQFTGRKDKKGKEIYDGDIGRLGMYVCVLTWIDKEACFKWLDEYGQYILGRPNDAEIIGNIYENPNILKELTP